MRRSLAAICLIAVVGLIPAAAIADPPPQPDTTAAAPAAAAGTEIAPNDPDKLYCVENSQPTGSHLSGGKECHTRADWEKMHSRMGALMQRMFSSQDANAQTGTPMGGH